MPLNWLTRGFVVNPALRPPPVNYFWIRSWMSDGVLSARLPVCRCLPLSPDDYDGRVEFKFRMKRGSENGRSGASVKYLYCMRRRGQ